MTGLHPHWKSFFKIMFIVLGAVAGVILLGFAYLNLPGPAPRQDVALGMTFSYRYATDLGLDWRETYAAFLDDLGVKKLRIPAYWDLVEKKPGVYDWEALDWQIAEAGKRGATIILAIGQKVPRWPECHIPDWARDTDAHRKRSLLAFEQTVVKRYRNAAPIAMWQVENEPFLPFGENCPTFDVSFLEQEVALVHSLDVTRKVLLTDSGELSLWYGAASRGDAFGTTMYRDIYKPGIGYFRYPVGPNFFRLKAWFIRTLAHQDDLRVIELQAEPWASGWVGNVSLEEQFKTMNPERLKENVDYARRVGFPEIYLWGGEWWYWLKVRKDFPAVWETGRELFRSGLHPAG